jgi:prolipoprotein diacylglyceryltransferase
MQEAILKDKILGRLVPNNLGQLPTVDVRSIATQLNVELYRVIYLAEIMSDAGYIVCIDIVNKDKSSVYAKKATLTHKGLYFLTYGGYKKHAEKERLGKYWTTTKIIATVIYSILVLLVAIWGILVQIKTDKNAEAPQIREKTK